MPILLSQWAANSKVLAGVSLWLPESPSHCRQNLALTLLKCLLVYGIAPNCHG